MIEIIIIFFLYIKQINYFNSLFNITYEINAFISEKLFFET